MPQTPKSAWPRLSRTEGLILELLVAGPERYGLELVTASGGRLKRGTVYVTLGRMEDKGLVESRQEAAPQRAIGFPRRLYRPTALGRRLLDAATMVHRMLAAEGWRERERPAVPPSPHVAVTRLSGAGAQARRGPDAR